MEKKEFAKFLSGFFAAISIFNVLILIAGIIPLKILNFNYDITVWTISLAVFFVLAVIFAYFGWGSKSGRKWGANIMIVFMAASFFIGFKLLDDGNIDILQASLSSSAESSEVNNPPATETESTPVRSQGEFTFNLGSDKYDGGEVIGIDDSGNIIVSGYFQGTVNMDISGGLTELSSQGNSLISSALDIYLAKYSPDKKLLWAASIGSVGEDMPLAMEIDNENNIYLAGYFGGLADFNSGKGQSVSLDAGTGRDGFLAKYNKDGNCEWAKKIGNEEKIPFTADDERFEKVVDVAISGNNVYAVGVFDDSINMDEPAERTPENTFKSNVKSRDIFIAQYDSSGQYIKGAVIGGMGRDEVRGIRAGSDGSLYITGSFIGSASFDFKQSKNSGAIILSGDDRDAFLAKYDKDLNFIWVKKWGGEGSDEPAVGGIEIDDKDNIYIAGNSDQSISIGAKILTNRGGTDIFFVEYNKDGKLLLAKSFGGAEIDSASKIKLDKEGNIYISGFFQSLCDFNPIKPAQALISVSDGQATDAFIAKYAPSGEYIWARDIGGSVSAGQIQSGGGIAVDSENNPIVIGTFFNKITFHSTESLDLKSNGNSDAFVVKYNSNGEIE
ncbi:MAG: hypothetical protein PHG23_02485 [Candidatus Pacebacteria bacterium]|nr:hypothetical protein [Candidatus Paceibacterota bacterium]